jgi:hypothetical protein
MTGVDARSVAPFTSCMAHRVLPGIINLVNAATHPFKGPDGHELLASFLPLL